MLSRLFILIVIAYACVKCDYFVSPAAQFRSQFPGSPNQNYGSPISPNQDCGLSNQNYGSSNQNNYDSLRIRDYTNIRQYLVGTALISSKATPVTYSPLRISFRGNAALVIRNNGSEVYSLTSQTEIGRLTGGPLENKVYLFGRIGQRNDGFPNKTRVSTTEDGEGFPIQFNVFYYNPVYGTYDNALNYRDGLVIFSINVIVEGVNPNPLFEAYRSVLTRVRYPNATAVITAYNVFEFLFSTLDTGYYVYPGAAVEAGTGRQLPCATIISPNFDKHPWLSYIQWQTIENVLNSNYQPLANPIPLFPLAGRFFGQANSQVYRNYY